MLDFGHLLRPELVVSKKYWALNEVEIISGRKAFSWEKHERFRSNRLFSLFICKIKCKFCDNTSRKVKQSSPSIPGIEKLICFKSLRIQDMIDNVFFFNVPFFLPEFLAQSSWLTFEVWKSISQHDKFPTFSFHAHNQLFCQGIKFSHSKENRRKIWWFCKKEALTRLHYELCVPEHLKIQGRMFLLITFDYRIIDNYMS